MTTGGAMNNDSTAGRIYQAVRDALDERWTASEISEVIAMATRDSGPIGADAAFEADLESAYADDPEAFRV